MLRSLVGSEMCIRDRFKSLFPILDLDIVIISSIMLLVPGLAITNAIRDSVAGDLLSGVTRMIDAFLTAVSIAIGTGISMSLWMNFFGGF